MTENINDRLSTLENKRILLGITGGIAAYKSTEVVRRLRDHGANVRVVMTPASQEFITPLTMQALSGNPVHVDLLDPKAEAAMGHIELARWADRIVVAPASADFISKLSHGEGSDLLSTLCLANHENIILAPAMNQGMWSSPATQSNVRLLRDRAVNVLGPASGPQACGDVGYGRMLEPDSIVEGCAASFESGFLSGKTVLITAGPTREAIDPVRYISNESSGKMGFAIARACIEAGAKTILVSGPVSLSSPDRCECIRVTSACEMYAQTMAFVEHADVFIAAAAVADYRPLEVHERKLKKDKQETLTVELVKNPDIVASVADLENKPYVVGFAAETHELESYARAKLSAKKLDMIVANDVSNPEIGFNSDENEVTVFTQTSTKAMQRVNKSALARELVKYISQFI